MAVNFSVPKSAQYLNTLTVLAAPFAGGVYNFVNPGNQKVIVYPLSNNALYFINKITIGGSIPQESYLANILFVPSILIAFLTQNQRIFKTALPLVQFSDGLEASAYFWTDRDKENLAISMPQGLLSQDASLVGVASVSLNISLSMFEITDSGYVEEFKKANKNSSIGLAVTARAPTQMYAY